MKPVALSGGRRRRGRLFHGASEPAYELDPGHPAHGLIRPSFVPETPTQELRAAAHPQTTLTAQVVVSETGIDMSRFPAAGPLISWAELAKVPLAAPVRCQRRADYARVMTKVPAGDAPPGCARARLGSRPPWCSAPGPVPAKKPAPCRPSSSACVTVEDRRRPSVPSPPRS